MRDILQKDYASRPSAQYIHDVIIPSFLQYSNLRSESRRLSLTSLPIKRQEYFYMVTATNTKYNFFPVILLADQFYII